MRPIGDPIIMLAALAALFVFLYIKQSAQREQRVFVMRGFTLLELVLSIAILGMIMFVCYSSIRQLIRSREVVNDNREGGALADAILSRMTRELQLAYWDDSKVLLLGLVKGESGKTGGNAALLGESNDGAGKERSDTITFRAREAGQYLPDGGGHTGIVQISYRLEPDPDSPRMEPPSMLLIRDEIPDINPEKEAYKRAMTFPVASNVISLGFQYYDAQADHWVESWGDDHPRTLPAIIRFEIAIRTPSGRIERYSTSVAPLPSST